MKGDIAHRSIRSSMSRIAEARLPRMISSVIGSTRGGAASGTRALQEEVVRGVDPGAEPRRHQRGSVVLLDDGRSLELQARAQGAPRVAGCGDEACPAEVDRPVAGEGGGQRASAR